MEREEIRDVDEDDDAELCRVDAPEEAVECDMQVLAQQQAVLGRVDVDALVDARRRRQQLFGARLFDGLLHVGG